MTFSFRFRQARLSVSTFICGFYPDAVSSSDHRPSLKEIFSLGDQTSAGRLPLDTSKTTNWFYFLSNIDILTSPDNHAVICYGDSITAQAWPDELMLRLLREGKNILPLYAVLRAVPEFSASMTVLPMILTV